MATNTRARSELVMTAEPRAQTEATTARTGGRDGRSLIFRGVVGLMLLLLLTGPGGLAELASPWLPVRPATADYTPELHRWHSTVLSAFVSLLVGGSLLALLARPRRQPLLAQFVLLALGTFILGHLSNPVIVPVVGFVALIAATYPTPRALLSVRQAGPVRRPILALAVAAASLLVYDVAANVRLQFIDVSEHAVHGHWLGAAVVAASLALAGLLASTGRPGWQVLGVVTGLTYLYLGVGALAIPSHDGSWGVTGGLLALSAGAGFLAATVTEGRRQGRFSPPQS